MWRAARELSLWRKACPVLDTWPESSGAAKMDSRFRGNDEIELQLHSIGMIWTDITVNELVNTYRNDI